MDLKYPEDCADWLTSKSKVNLVGEKIVAEQLDYTLLRQLQCYRLFRLFALEDHISSVVAFPNAKNALVSARLKRIPSIVRKLQRSPKMQLARLADMIGIRIVCSSLSEARNFLRYISKLDTFHRSLDYVAEPQKTGYRAFHVVLRNTEKIPGKDSAFVLDIEIQIRSYLQHLWALTSESFGEQVKEGGGSKKQRDYLLKLSERITEIEDQQPDKVQEVFKSHKSQTSHVAVVRTNRKTSGNHRIDPYGEDFYGAVRQLMAWEDDISDGLEESLLLVGVGNLSTLGWTHSTFLGMDRVPLPDYLPKFRTS